MTYKIYSNHLACNICSIYRVHYDSANDGDKACPDGNQTAAICPFCAYVGKDEGRQSGHNSCRHAKQRSIDGGKSKVGNYNAIEGRKTAVWDVNRNLFHISCIPGRSY
jgi:hypothetical protein